MIVATADTVDPAETDVAAVSHSDAMHGATAGGAPLRILTLNAHQGCAGLRRRALLLRIREALRASGADLVFLQEVGGGVDRQGVAEEHYEMLADQVWSQHAYGRNAVAGKGHQGNALLSKHPIVRWKNIDVSVGHSERRGLLHCVIDVRGHHPHPLHAVCVHLGLRESHRQHQVDRLVELIAREVPPAAPLLVAGDFNDWRGRAHARLVEETGMTEVGSTALGSPARTFPAWWPLLRLDRIYARNLRHRLLSMPRRPWSALSDHIPLAGEVRI